MEPRRSTRIPSGHSMQDIQAKQLTAAPEQKPGAAKPKANPVPKPDVENPVAAAAPKEKPVKKAACDSSQHAQPYLNPLPTPPAPLRPAPLLFVWGAGNDGQFGTGASTEELTTERRSPTRNRWVEEQIALGRFGKSKGAAIETIVAGGLHTMFVDENGVVWTCGNNDEAALGRQTAEVPDQKKRGEFIPEDELTAVPHPVQSLVSEGFRAVRIAAGDNISGAISTEGELRVWGCFRANEGLLGFSSNKKHQALPSAILALPTKGSDVEKAVALAAGTNHLLVLTTHGNVYAWGAGDSAQLGRRVLERRKIHGTVPEKVVLGTRARRAVAIAAGSYHSFAIDIEGDVWGWGANHLGQTGTGRQHGAADDEVCLPAKVKGLGTEELGDGEKVVQIAGGEHHSLFLTSKGRVFACGRAYNGQLGLSDHDPAIVNRTDKDSLPEPVLVRFPDGNEDDQVVQVAAGAHNSMAVTEGGALFAWGQGTNGELGAKEDDEVRMPKEIVRRTGGTWKALQVACGGQHSLGLFLRKS